jgi:hypothetical protein
MIAKREARPVGCSVCAMRMCSPLRPLKFDVVQNLRHGLG